MGVGAKNTPHSFRNSCDEFVFLENILSESKIYQNDQHDSKLKNQGDIKQNREEHQQSVSSDIHDLLREAFEKYQDDDGYVNVSSAGTFIKRVKPDFDVRSYGYIKLPKLIEDFPEKYEIKRYPGKGTVTIIAYKCN